MEVISIDSGIKNGALIYRDEDNDIYTHVFETKNVEEQFVLYKKYIKCYGVKIVILEKMKIAHNIYIKDLLGLEKQLEIYCKKKDIKLYLIDKDEVKTATKCELYKNEGRDKILNPYHFYNNHIQDCISLIFIGERKRKGKKI